MMAAILLRIPTLAYEPNAVPGLANRLVGRFVGAAAVSFEQTARYFRNASVTGGPIRQAIFDVPPRPAGASPRLLITAGSQGAKILNETMPLIVVRLLETVPGLTILHQSGPKHVEATTAADDPQRRNAEVFAEAGAAVMLLQRALTPEVLLAELTRLLGDRETLEAMGAKARALARYGALEKIAGLVVGLAGGKE
jgi:UDP-N-acetylglucosamine--N-acetylmuramyl-(pentapeptide) pyrophosphoryl-undecaprenol N-acetylglucosamine transferase